MTKQLQPTCWLFIELFCYLHPFMVLMIWLRYYLLSDFSLIMMKSVQNLQIKMFILQLVRTFVSHLNSNNSHLVVVRWKFTIVERRHRYKYKNTKQIIQIPMFLSLVWPDRDRPHDLPHSRHAIQLHDCLLRPPRNDTK